MSGAADIDYLEGKITDFMYNPYLSEEYFNKFADVRPKMKNVSSQLKGIASDVDENIKGYLEADEQMREEKNTDKEADLASLRAGMLPYFDEGSSYSSIHPYLYSGRYGDILKAKELAEQRNIDVAQKRSVTKNIKNLMQESNIDFDSLSPNAQKQIID